MIARGSTYLRDWIAKAMFERLVKQLETDTRARRSLAGVIVDLGNSPHDPHKRWTLAPDPSPPGEGTPPQSGRVAE